MSIESVMGENREAVRALVAAAERCGSHWTAPAAPGKWSPSQVTEHVARALEESGKAVRGEGTRFPNVPFMLRPLLRMFLRRVVKTGAMSRGRTNKAMNPDSGPASPGDARARLESAMALYEAACTDAARRSPTFVSSVFGTVTLEEYGRFQAIHTLHHSRQLPA